MGSYWQREGSPPTAPPLPGQPAGAGDRASSSSSLASAAKEAGPAAAERQAMYQDLLRRANGDQQLVSLWLAEMGFRPSDFEQQEQGSIKAVGTQAGGLAGWGSLTAARSRSSSPSKAKVAAPGAAAPPSPDKDLDTQAAEAGAPRHFFCPISMAIMRDPVCLPTGQTYDRPCIERWLNQGNNSCPATGQALTPPVTLVPNVALRNAIEEWAEKHAPWLLDHNRRVKPVPKDEQFGAMPPPSAVADPDMAYAIRLQQEELNRIASQRQRQQQQQQWQAGGGGSASVRSFGVAAPGVAGAAGAAPAPAPSRRGPPPPPRQQQRSRWSATFLLLLALTAAQVALYIVSLAKDGWHIANLKLNPWAGASQAALLDVGAQEASLVNGSQWWRLFTSPFVNAGVIQLLFNLSCMWTLGRYLEAALLRPLASIATIWLVGAWLGALASANLNSYYVTCGASAGVCALLGAVWADQLVNSRKYVNHGLTCLVLTLITAIFIVASLLPMLDPWYQAVALLAGFLCGTLLLLLPRVGRGRRGSGRWLTVQGLCAFLLIAAAVVATLGIVLDVQAGTKAEFLEDGSCVGMGWWQCLPAGSSPNGCSVEAQASGASLIYCPSGSSAKLPAGTTLGSRDMVLISQLCSQYCNGPSTDEPSTSPGDNWGTGNSGGGGGNGSPPAGASAPPSSGSNSTSKGGTGAGGSSEGQLMSVASSG